MSGAALKDPRNSNVHSASDERIEDTTHALYQAEPLLWEKEQCDHSGTDWKAPEDFKSRTGAKARAEIGLPQVSDILYACLRGITQLTAAFFLLDPAR